MMLTLGHKESTANAHNWHFKANNKLLAPKRLSLLSSVKPVQNHFEIDLSNNAEPVQLFKETTLGYIHKKGTSKGSNILLNIQEITK